MARSTKLCPEVQERICAVARQGGTRRAAAGSAGVDESTVRRWLERGRQDDQAGEDTPHRDLLRALNEAEALGELAFSNVLYEVATDPTANAADRIRAALGVLSRRFGWSERVEVETPQVTVKAVDCTLPDYEADQAHIDEMLEKLRQRNQAAGSDVARGKAHIARLRAEVR